MHFGLVHANKRTNHPMTVVYSTYITYTCFVDSAFHWNTNGGLIWGISSHFGLVLIYRRTDQPIVDINHHMADMYNCIHRMPPVDTLV